MSKKSLLVCLLATIFVFVGSFSSATAGNISLSQIVDILITSGAIPPDKVAAARALINENNNPATAEATPTQTSIISSCGEITRSGTYIVDRDLQITTNNVPCLNVHDTENVHISCNNRLIKSSADNAILILNVKNFSVRSCHLRGGGLFQGLLIRNAADGEVADSKITPTVNIMDSVRMKILRNTINGFYKQSFTTDSRIEMNTIDYSWESSFGAFMDVGFAVSLMNGSNNVLTGNKINGHASGVFNLIDGPDDGVVLADENRDIINNNIITNIWDCGIETYGFVSNTSINNNSLKNIGICGIGGWYYNSFKGNTIANNIVDDVPFLFFFYRSFGLRSQETDITGHTTPADDKIYFKDNVFENNKLINPRPKGTYGSYSSGITMSYLSGVSSKSSDRTPTAADYVLGNNLFKNNDFSIVPNAPTFGPASMIIDGGGNICSTPTNPSTYPIKCNNTSVVTPVATTYNCSGIEPSSNSYISKGASTYQGGSVSTTWTYVSGNPSSCQYTCTNGGTYNGNSCIAPVIPVTPVVAPITTQTPAQTSTSTQTIVVSPAINNPPTASITGSTNLTVGQTGTWNFSVADRDGNLSKWRFYASTNSNPQWSCTSGGLPPCNTVNSAASGTYSTSFSSAGTYIWMVDAMDSSGAPGNASITVTVTNPAPVNNPPTAFINGSTNLTVRETGSWSFGVADQDGNLSQWQFCASTNSSCRWTAISGSSVSGTYSTSFSSVGTYTWVVNVKDSSGAPGNASITVSVTDPTSMNSSQSNLGNAFVSILFDRILGLFNVLR